jgi:hypothetical protein
MDDDAFNMRMAVKVVILLFELVNWPTCQEFQTRIEHVSYDDDDNDNFMIFYESSLQLRRIHIVLYAW